MLTLVLVGTLLALIAMRVPISVSIGIAVVLALVIGDFPLSVLPRMMTDGLESFPLLAVPFFVLAGNLMNAGGMTERIFAFARALFGPISGGLAQVNVAASMIFAGMSGAALADLAGLGAVEIRAMRANGYPIRIATGITLASCTIGPIIPPSIVLIIYGVSTDTSIGRLFLAGIVPGLMLGAILMSYIYLWVRLGRTEWGQAEPFNAAEIWHTFKRGAAALALPLIVVGALVSGASTPTEVGALASAYALLVGILFRDLTWHWLWQSLVDSVTTTAVIMLIISVSVVMGWIITMERIPHEAASVISDYVTSPIWGILALTVFLLFVGMFLETVPAILILSPILLPIVVALEIDPVHFGIVICFNLIIGIITPPMGIGLFVASRVAQITPEQVLRGVLPFLPPLLFGLLIIALVPTLSTWLPDLVFGAARR